MTKIIYFDVINHMNKSSVERTKANYEDKLWFLIQENKIYINICLRIHLDILVEYN
jgi:hypothetical protein